MAPGGRLVGRAKCFSAGRASWAEWRVASADPEPVMLEVRSENGFTFLIPVTASGQQRLFVDFWWSLIRARVALDDEGGNETVSEGDYRSEAPENICHPTAWLAGDTVKAAGQCFCA